MPRTGRELAIVVIVAAVALITGLLAHQYFGHGPTADETERIEARDKAAVGAAVAAGEVAERDEQATLDHESDDQVLADAAPAVQAAVDQAIRDHEWLHHR